MLRCAHFMFVPYVFNKSYQELENDDCGSIALHIMFVTYFLLVSCCVVHHTFDQGSGVQPTKWWVWNKHITRVSEPQLRK
jgi:hypothetical protein